MLLVDVVQLQTKEVTTETPWLQFLRCMKHDEVMLELKNIITGVPTSNNTNLGPMRAKDGHIRTLGINFVRMGVHQVSM
jgi:hypothetical protein